MWTAQPSESNAAVPTPREAFVAGLRDMADFYEAHPDLEVPYHCGFDYFIHGDDAKARLAEWARVAAPVEKDTCGDGPNGYFVVRKKFGPLKVEANVVRQNICTPRVVRVEQIPEHIIPEQVVPAHNVEVIEWECPSILADAAEYLERSIDDAFAAVDKVFPVEVPPSAIVAMAPATYSFEDDMEYEKRHEYDGEQEEYNPNQDYFDNGVDPKDFA